MERLEPIPTPWSIRWREFRIRFVPVILFTLVLGLAALFWDAAGVGGVAGMAEAEHSLVSAPQGGVLGSVLVQPYQIVEAGQPLATLRPADARTVFDRLQAELALGRLQTQPSVAEGNAMNFERIRVELLRTKSELAIAKVNLARAEREVTRYTPLHREQLLSEDLFELSLNTRDALRAEVEAKTAAAAIIERRLSELSAFGVPGVLTNAPTNVLLTRLEALLNEATTTLSPVTLVAPRGGMVHFILRQPGENVLPGEPLFSVSPLRSERIVAYLRQPYPVELSVGMPVEVVTRERNRRVFPSQIAQIGARVEVITNALAFVRPNTLVDSGLPFVVHLPADVDLRPGELVDLRITEKTESSVLESFGLGRAGPLSLKPEPRLLALP
jgi:multidrug resistance efflux pump